MFERLFGDKAESKLIQEAFDHSSSMLRQAGRMFDLALAGLVDNEPIDVDLESMDDRLDNSEQEVRRNVLEHLAVSPGHDLVASLILVSVIQDAERIGDFAKGLGDLTDLTDRPRSGPFADDLRELAGRVRSCFDECEKAFSGDNAEAASSVIESHVDNKARLREYIGRVASSDLPADLAVLYSSAARFVSRTSAHLSNIASTVVMPFDRSRHGDEEG